MAWREELTIGMLTLEKGVQLPVVRLTSLVVGLKAATSGTTYIIDSSSNAVGITLPEAKAGLNFRFYMLDSTTESSITAYATADYLLGGVNELETDTTEDGPNTIVSDAADVMTLTTGCVAGDVFEFISDGTYWYYTGQVAADGAVSIA